jgi:branched-chain amino acid transport system substrate-binding protein
MQSKKDDQSKNGIQSKKSIIIIAIILAIIIIVIPVLYLSNVDKSTDIEIKSTDSNPDQPSVENIPQKLTGDVWIGVLLPTSGDLESHGKENNKAIEIAIQEFNAHLGNNSSWKLKAEYKNSATDPVIALEHMENFHKQDIDIIIGLESSQNIEHIQQYASNNGMLLLSCCSSATSLGIAGDYLFRLVPDDSKQASVLVQLLIDEQIEVIIPVVRNDLWGNDFYNEIENKFKKNGGNITKGIKYYPKSPESVSMSKLNEMLSEPITKIGPEKVALLFLSFKEIAYFMESAEKLETENNLNLERVTWYGPGAITKIDEINTNLLSLEFSQKINLTTVQIKPLNNNNTESIAKEIKRLLEIEYEPNSFVYSSYDSVWIIGKAIEHANGKMNKETIQEAIENITDNYQGTIGSTKLNDAGDLEQANYDVWRFKYGKWNSTEYYTFNENTKKWKYINNTQDSS